jgi:hypothetical protein
MEAIMKYWFIIHDLNAYRQHPDYIGKEKQRAGKITKVHKGDKIIYYATSDSVIVGTFEVIKKPEEWKSDKLWIGHMVCMKIKPRYLHPDYVPIHNIVKGVPTPISIFPDRTFKPILFRGQTAVEITKNDFIAIEKFIKSYKPETKLFKGLTNDGNLGEPIDIGILNYAPTSEQGVVALFVHFMDKLAKHKFAKIEFIRAGFPDSCVIEKEANSFSRKYIEFEFKASKFKEHIRNKKHVNTKCDYVVCWENDFHSCPIEVIELKRELSEILGKEIG